MPADRDFSGLQQRFAELWQSLVRDGEMLRSDEERNVLVDQVRDALDRGANRLQDAPRDIIANTFLLEQQISRGLMTEVFRVRHRDLGSCHVLKLLRADHANDPTARQLLLREAAIGLNLRHPNIIATQTSLKLADGRPAIVFEYCQNNLAERCSSAPMSAHDIHAIMTGILSGLDEIHEHGIVHGDLSPSNILFAEQSFTSLRITDFGIALRRGENHQELDLRFAGQPHFAAPEQKQGSMIDHRADLFSAGRILTWMLQNSDRADAANLHTLAAHLSQPRPQERPKTAKAALQMLGGL